MTWSIDEVEEILLVVVGVFHGGGLCLHCDSSISFDFEFIKVLVTGIFGDGVGDF